MSKVAIVLIATLLILFTSSSAMCNGSNPPSVDDIVTIEIPVNETNEESLGNLLAWGFMGILIGILILLCIMILIIKYKN